MPIACPFASKCPEGAIAPTNYGAIIIFVLLDLLVFTTALVKKFNEYTMQFIAANPKGNVTPPTFGAFLKRNFLSFLQLGTKKEIESPLVVDEYTVPALEESADNQIDYSASKRRPTAYARFSTSLTNLSLFTREITRIPVTQNVALRDFEQMYRKGLDDMKLSMDFKFYVCCGFDYIQKYE